MKQPAKKPETALVLPADPNATAMSVAQMLGQVALIQQVMQAAMKDGEHYGKIPGCGDRPALLKSGAEKLCLCFRLAPTYDVLEKELPGGHREYRICCSLTSILPPAPFMGQGVGICSTLEAKYRFRAGKGEPTDKPVPRAYWDVRQEDPAKAQELIGGKGYTTIKVDGKGWMIARGGEKVEHDNPADHYNTVLKMAKKRALVDAVLTCTAASDIFSQDIEDIAANMAVYTVEAEVVTKEPPPEPPTPLPVPVQPPPAPAPQAAAPVETQAQLEIVNDPQPGDFRDTKIHFGKNAGVALSELTPQAVHWYETDWMPKKEGAGTASADDKVLIDALKRYKAWRSGKTLANPAPASPATATPRNEGSEGQDSGKQKQGLESAANASGSLIDTTEGGELVLEGQGEDVLPASWRSAVCHRAPHKGWEVSTFSATQRGAMAKELDKLKLKAAGGKAEFSKEDRVLEAAIAHADRCAVVINAIGIKCDKHGVSLDFLEKHVRGSWGLNLDGFMQYPEDILRRILDNAENLILDSLIPAC